ncbi:hypothetical protein WME89_27385 [Sorangium sp. So ce321]|uniref:hypothetical protein n=1 Tax=Sorangium sp. So ce321 TaxID=3133300 RepID=UPI003F6170A1
MMTDGRNTSGRSVLVIDLETVVDPSLPPPPKTQKGDGDVFPPIPCHQVVVMGAALLDMHYRLRRIWIVGEGKGERDMLLALINFLNERLTKRDALTIVGFNSRGFDMPVIVARCLRHGIAFPWYYARREVRYRYSTEGHFDVMDFLTDFGASRAYSLDLAAKLIGMPGKAGCDGADVATMVAAGQIEQVRAYCLGDVAQTAGLYLRTQLLRGELAPAAYVAAMEVLLAALEREPRLAPLLPRIDRKQLLLAS